MVITSFSYSTNGCKISQSGIEHDELKNLDGNYPHKSNLTKKSSSEMR